MKWISQQSSKLLVASSNLAPGTKGDILKERKEDELFLKELFDIDDVQVEHISGGHYDVYMTGVLVLCAYFNGEKLTIAKPQSMSTRRRFVINDKNIQEIRKSIEKIWINNYIELSNGN